MEALQTYQLLIPPSIESKLVCGLNTLIPFAESFKRDAWRVLDSFRDLFYVWWWFGWAIRSGR
jgi:hypothetical protein